MEARRVFLIWTHALFLESIRLILKRHPGVELVGAESDHRISQEKISALRPDVVIIEDTDPMAESNGETMSILQRGPKVIRLSLSDNELAIFQRRSRTVAEADDLLQLILEQSDDC